MSYRGHIAGCYFLAPVVCHHCMPPVRKYLPQVDVKAHASILSTVARVTLTQSFDVPYKDQGIKKLNYTFPLFDGVNVVGFKCHVKDRVIVGEVKERDEARQDFQAAVQRGEVAGLLEQLPDASDVFTTTVGNIPPNCTVTVEITYLSELRHDAEVDGIRFTIPTTIAPRYGSYPGELAAAAPTAAGSGRFEVVIDTTLDNGAAIRQLSSPTHPITVSLGTVSTAAEADPALNKASATLSLGSAEMDKDFVLQIVSKDLGKPVAVVETHPTIPGHRAIMATLVPKFQMKPHQPEIVFVCDRSGSMQGTSIEALKNALNVFLKSLPVGVLFNICSFGSRYEFLWPKSQAYNQGTVQRATEYIKSFSANFGGTEMYEPILESLNRRFKDRSMELFLVTDGQIWNEQRLFGLLNERIGTKKEPVRVFTLGIGHGASHSLINGVARAGRGFAQSVGENEKLDGKVIRMLKGALFPHVDDYSLDVKYASDASESDDDFEIVEKVSDGLRIDEVAPEAAEPPKPISLFDESANIDATPVKAGYDGPRVTVPVYLQAPQAIPPLFPFSRTTVYVLLDPAGPKGTPNSVILRGTSAQGPLELAIPVSALDSPGETIHQLAAKRAVADLEDGRGWLDNARLPSGALVKSKHPSHMSELVRAECVRLGVKFQVGGKHCSFVATEKDADDSAMRDEFAFVEDRLEGLALEQGKQHSCAAARPRGYGVVGGRAGPSGAARSPPQQTRDRDRSGPLPQRRSSQSSTPSAHSQYNSFDHFLSGQMAGPKPFASAAAGLASSLAQQNNAARLARIASKSGAAPLVDTLQQQPAPPPPRQMMQQVALQSEAIGPPFDFAKSRLRGAQPMSYNMDYSTVAPPPAPGHVPMFGGAPAGSAFTPQTGPSFGPGQSWSGGGGGPEGVVGFASSIASQMAASPLPLAKSSAPAADGWRSRLDSYTPTAYAAAPRRVAKKSKAGFRAGGTAAASVTDDLMDMGGAEPKMRSDDDSEDEGEAGRGSLQGLVALQGFDGAWRWEKGLLRLVGVEDGALARFGEVDPAVAATVLAVHFLQTKLKDEKDGWELLVDKATAWLEGQVGAEKMAVLFAEAAKII